MFNIEDKYSILRKKVNLSSPPCLPYLGNYLADVTAILGRSEDDKINGLINFHKRRIIAKIIREILKFQRTSYCLLTVPQIRDYLLEAPVWDVKTLEEYIIYREPKFNTEVEKPEPIFMTTLLSENYPLELREEKPNPIKYSNRKIAKKKENLGRLKEKEVVQL